jgi:ribA/ribD-fused uncharacterized protein
MSAAPSAVIKFYSTRHAYGCFSNFAACRVVIDGATWQTTEHYFQAMKFAGSPADVAAVAAAPGPMDAAKMGRDRRRPLRRDWERVKDGLMHDCVLAKFRQSARCRAELLATGDAVLVEHTKNDRYWGDGGDGSGKNMLGKTLMRVRGILRAEAADGATRDTAAVYDVAVTCGAPMATVDPATCAPGGPVAGAGGAVADVAVAIVPHGGASDAGKASACSGASSVHGVVGVHVVVTDVPETSTAKRPRE